MRCPYSLWAFAVRKSDTFDEVEGIYLVVFLLVHGLVELRDGGDQCHSRWWLDGIRPMLVNTCEDIREPLARDVVTDKDQEDHDILEDRTKYEVHVRISSQWIRNALQKTE